MHALLAPVGSRGDVQPMLALARALLAAGHSVLLCASPDNAAWAQRCGVPFVSVGPDFRAWVTERPQSLGGAWDNLRETAQVAQRFLSEQFSWLAPYVPHADVVLAVGMQVAAASLAERHGVAYHYLAQHPTYLPSAAHAPMVLPWQAMPRWANRASWRVCEAVTNALLRGLLNAQRQRLGLAPAASVYASMLGARPLVALDPELASVPEDVRLPLLRTDAWCYEGPGASLSPEVEGFLARGAPPVFVGFGSMPDAAPERTTELLLSAVRATGRRVLLQRGWAQLGAGARGDDVHVLDDAPHELLFPRVAAVVHHGGAGTVARAARAGVPQVLVPHAIDQFFWARALRERGLTPRAVPRASLRAAALSRALEEALTEPAFAREARALARRLEGRNGLARACELLAERSLRK